ncbi:HK97 gp10 family phage protein [Deinococcus gobiensis]|uniref:HK97 gp10 family phage protein n=1 Tax=Deinococcus gobiensis (strain DSM 21396 / JCM 16679 / CGMCC 1.7299 / I-0) TaxID=745776 RepID=H8GX95_DEIGI|nr:HK97 gp10 family phage protein [Deinococcus gobiensis]AFD25824.1 hypothetical protein DGo_CA1897 [Deinococcus gobiensis I-0]
MSLADAARAAAQRVAGKQAALIAQELRTEMVRNLSTPGQGREYPRGRGRVHRASAPGDGPAVDTGRLRQSIGIQRISPTHFRVGTNVIYAPLLEFGTRKIAARPWLRPAVDKVLNR